MGFNKKFPNDYMWLNNNYTTNINKRFTAKQREILLKFYTEEEIIELCDRWFIVIEHTEFGLISYNELLHKRLAQIDDIISTKIDEIDMENSTERIRLDMNNMWRIFVNAHFTKLIKELQEYGFPKSNIKYKEVFQEKEQTDLRFAFLENVNFYGAVFLGIRFEGSYISNSLFKYSMFSTCNFAGSECSTSSFEGSQFTKVNFGYSECIRNDFSGVKISNASFEHSKLSESSFVLSHIRNVNFKYADCNSINLKGSKIIGANLKNAIFDNAVFGRVEVIEKNKRPRNMWTSLQSITFNFNTSLKNCDITSVSGFTARALINLQNSKRDTLSEKVYFLGKNFANIKDNLNRIRYNIPSILKKIIAYTFTYIVVIGYIYRLMIYLMDGSNISNVVTKFITFLYVPVELFENIASKTYFFSSYGDFNPINLILIFVVSYILSKSNYLYININKELKINFWSKGV